MSITTPDRKYQEKDKDKIDYRYEVLEGCSFAVRGPLSPPQTTSSQHTVACLGSAATFGRHVHRPYSALLAESTGAHVINLGVGGARPEWYLREPKILELCRKTDLVVLELMSARSYSSDFYTPIVDHRKFGGIAERYAAMMSQMSPRRLREKKVSRVKAFAWAAENLSREELQKIRQQMLDAYRHDACALIQSIDRPVVLLWLSRRSIDKAWEPGSYKSLHGGFPHFIDRETVDEIGKHAIGLVDVTSTTGAEYGSSVQETPEMLTKRTKAGDIIAYEDGYYASPEMHEEAARRLKTFLTAYWSSGQP
jgi:hypothetical protein